MDLVKEVGVEACALIEQSPRGDVASVQIAIWGAVAASRGAACRNYRASDPGGPVEVALQFADLVEFVLQERTQEHDVEVGAECQIESMSGRSICLLSQEEGRRYEGHRQRITAGLLRLELAPSKKFIEGIK